MILIPVLLMIIRVLLISIFLMICLLDDHPSIIDIFLSDFHNTCHLNDHTSVIKIVKIRLQGTVMIGIHIYIIYCYSYNEVFLVSIFQMILIWLFPLEHKTCTRFKDVWDFLEEKLKNKTINQIRNVVSNTSNPSVL